MGRHLGILGPGSLLILWSAISGCSSLLKADDSTFAAGVVDSGSRSTESGAHLAAAVEPVASFGPPSNARGTTFGTPLALDGDTVAAGASFEDIQADGGIRHRAGATYLFDLAHTGSLPRRIVVPDASEGDGALPSNIVPTGVTDLQIPLPGLFVALGEDVLAIAVPGKDVAPEDSSNDGEDAGAVYVYDRASLDLLQRIAAPFPHAHALFGWSIAVSGAWLAIAAPGDANGTPREGDDQSAPKSGAVYLYHRNDSDGLFEEAQYIKAPIIGAQDWFGNAVAIDGERLVIGATAEDGGGSGMDADPNDRSSPNSGAVYVYHRTSTPIDGSSERWLFERYLKPNVNNPLVGPQNGFGWDVAVSGSRIAVGAGYAGSCSNDDPRAPGRGAVYVVDTATWSETCLGPASGAREVLLGWSIAMDGDRVVAGAVLDSRGVLNDPTDVSRPGSGAAYVFEYGPGGWGQEAYLKSPRADGAGFGYSVDIRPGRIVVSSADPLLHPTNVQSQPTPASDGAFYVFSL